MNAEIRQASCRHCGLPSRGASDYCCRGCETAHRLIAGAGLEKFYELRGATTTGPPREALFERSRERLWLEETADILASADSLVSVDLGISGLTCAACVWLVERAVRRHPGVGDIVVNSARATAVLTATSELDLRELADELSQLGYRLVPPDDARVVGDDALLIRVGIAWGLALNSMLLSAAIYLGLESGWLHRFFVGLSAALALGSLIVGMQVFGRRALASLRVRSISLDVPIALGIVAVFVASVWGVAVGRSSAIFFDTLSVFVALMATGRLVQERVLRANRARIAASDELLDLGARLIESGRPRSVSAASLSIGDRIIVPHGEVVPTDVRLEDDRAGCQLDWLTGESAPRVFRAGETIPGGAINSSRRAFTATVAAPLAETALPGLLATPGSNGDRAQTVFAAAAPYYVAAVLSVAFVGFGAWLIATADVARSLEITAAILVVTCPCALGIGGPLAFELIAAKLARGSAYVRTPDALTKLAAVQHIAFDKTGTITESGLEVSNPEVLAALSSFERHILFNLAARSAHPHSVAIADAMPGVFDPSISAVEQVGAGMSTDIARDGQTMRFQLGRRNWALGQNHGARGTAFACDGKVIATPMLVEKLRDDARSEIDKLLAAGYQISLVSGDDATRVIEVATRLGFAADDIVAEATPDDKAKWIADVDRGDLLFVGDGLNDAPALEAATVSATPSLESPLLAERVDLYFAGRGIRPIGRALEAAHLLKRVQHGLLVFIVFYNAIVVAAALAGLMKPWLAAVLMPASSVLVTAATTLAIHKGMSWKSSRS